MFFVQCQKYHALLMFSNRDSSSKMSSSNDISKIWIFLFNYKQVKGSPLQQKQFSAKEKLEQSKHFSWIYNAHIQSKRPYLRTSWGHYVQLVWDEQQANTGQASKSLKPSLQLRLCLEMLHIQIFTTLWGVYDKMMLVIFVQKGTCKLRAKTYTEDQFWDLFNTTYLLYRPGPIWFFIP